MLKVYSIGSSSSGNSYIIQGGSTAVLLDVGLAGKTIKQGIAEAGLSPADIQGILVTHEHIDHVRSVNMMAKNCSEAMLYASRGTIGGCSNFNKVDKSRINLVAAGDCFTIGDLSVKTFALSHDAKEPVSYSFECGGDRLSVVTDTGVVTEDIYKEIICSNKLVFESNHEEGLLMVGPYPYSVKRRILSDYGHLSNAASGDALSRMLKDRTYDGQPDIMLAHLSSNNNTPSQAEWTVTEKLADKGFDRMRDYRLDIALKEGLSVLE
ncbi:MAG: MBL fold metallo-hydrolase [Clostridiales bacterium]|nr:MBL fold metallo-hydrolase [Candidatus Crickella merdequi]